MISPSDPAGNAKVVIPPDVQAKFPDLVTEILASKSMDDEERNYWFSVLPVMTEPQIAELKGILDDEQKKLAAIDRKYTPAENLTPEQLKVIEAEKQQKRRERLQAEHREANEDKEEADALLSELDKL